MKKGKDMKNGYYKYPDGTKEWYLNDIEVTEKDFNQWLDKRNLHDKLQSILIEKPIEKKSKI